MTISRPGFRPRLEVLEDRCVPTAFDSFAVSLPVVVQWRDQRLDQIAAQANSHPSVVFLGDSILDYYANGVGAPIWNAELGPYGAADDAIYGNTAHNVLWQVQNGLLDNMSPRAIVLMVGVNDLILGQTPDATALTIGATVAAIRSAQPQAQILLLGILPADFDPGDPIRTEIMETNSMLTALTVDPHVHYADLGNLLLGYDGTFLPGTTVDGTHPSLEGYELLTPGLIEALSFAEGYAHY